MFSTKLNANNLHGYLELQKKFKANMMVQFSQWIFKSLAQISYHKKFCNHFPNITARA